MENQIVSENKVCRQCGKSYINKDRRSLYCSKSCCSNWNQHNSPNLAPCKIEGCGRKHSAKGYCQTHYRQEFNGKLKIDVNRKCLFCETPFEIHKRRDALFCSCSCRMKYYRRHGCYTAENVLKNRGECSIEGCGNPVSSHRMCSKHSVRVWKYGDPHAFRDFRYTDEKCLVEGCGEPAKVSMLCKRHSGIVCATRRYRRLRRATPKWVDFVAILNIYQQVETMRKQEGINYEVDHIVPLKGNKVHGLHVPWNLQPLERRVNGSKGNRIHHIETQGCDFSAPGFIGSLLYTPKSPELPAHPQPSSQGSLCF